MMQTWNVHHDKEAKVTRAGGDVKPKTVALHHDSCTISTGGSQSHLSGESLTYLQRFLGFLQTTGQTPH